MSSTAILAHYDPHGEVAGYVLRLLDHLGDSFDEVVVVSTAQLTESARDELSHRSTVIERENVGQDFGGWHEVLRDRTPIETTRRLLLTNDTYVGLLRPLSDIEREMADKPVEFWGITENQQIARHIQSFFVMITDPVPRSTAWSRFWDGFTAQAERKDVILSHEVGLSQALLSAGFDGAAYFNPTAEEVALAGEREAWRRDRIHELYPETERAQRYQTNYTYALADAALRDGRLPLVKIEVLRYDPCFLGEGALLDLCEERYPAQFEGVRDYLERTAPAYPPRAGENPGGALLPEALRSRLGYRCDL